MVKKKTILLFAIIIISYAKCLCAGEFHALENKDVKILFEPKLEWAAKEVAGIYPEIKIALEDTFGWDLNLRPSVLLIKDRNRFQNLILNPLTVAFAVPKSNLIIVDYTKMTLHPFTIENTLKHELCHLLLHHHINGHILPRWLDEGVCQWASDGIADIIMDQKRSYLNKAASRGTFIQLNALQKGFPRKKESLLLAYEESKSFVAHIISRFGKEGLLKVLEQMKKGVSVDTAIRKALSTPLGVLEREWHQSIRKKTTWFTLLSYYLYEILFALMALLSIFAFIKIMIKKRAYMQEDPEDSLFS